MGYSPQVTKASTTTYRVNNNNNLYDFSQLSWVSGRLSNGPHGHVPSNELRDPSQVVKIVASQGCPRNYEKLFYVLLAWPDLVYQTSVLSSSKGYDL